MKPLLIGLSLIGLMACRGQPSELPPVHLNPNMDTQEKYKPQSQSRFFQDKRTMRTPPEGTVARGLLKEDDVFYRGKQNDQFVPTIPVEVTNTMLARGERQFNIYCSPCHDKTGSGQGIVAQRGQSWGMVRPTNYHDDRLRNMPDGEIFNAITNGVRTMPSYRHQINEEDRWAIVAHIRVLQRAQNASLQDVPEQKRTTLQ
jgi:mono/diheme cytochrome c family protein